MPKEKTKACREMMEVKRGEKEPTGQRYINTKPQKSGEKMQFVIEICYFNACILEKRF